MADWVLGIPPRAGCWRVLRADGVEERVEVVLVPCFGLRARFAGEPSLGGRSVLGLLPDVIAYAAEVASG